MTITLANDLLFGFACSQLGFVVFFIAYKHRVVFKEIYLAGPLQKISIYRLVHTGSLLLVIAGFSSYILALVGLNF